MSKLLFIFVALVLALGAIADGANPDGSVANSKFKTGDRVWTTTDLKVRSDPGLASVQIDSLGDGNSMIKGNTGTILDGPVSKDDYIWWNISYDIGITGWSAEKYIELVPDGPEQPDSFAQWGEDAITWATDKDRMSSKNWNEECLRFVSNAFRQKDASGESGYSTAANAARDLYRFNQEQGGWQHAPKGTVILFDGKGGNPSGHVGIYLGDGNIINAYGSVKEIAIEEVITKPDVGKYIGWSYPPEAWRPEATGEIKSHQPTIPSQTNALKQQADASTPVSQSNNEGRQQLINAVKDLENATLDSLDYSTHQTADSYALLATAADLTKGWGEFARLALDTINSVVGLAMLPEDFLSPDGARKALKDPSIFKQIITGAKDSKKILGAISAADAFRGIFKDAESYKLSFQAISKTEDAARQEYEASGDNTRTSNAAWLELWTPSTMGGLLIPLREDTFSGNANHKSIIWVDGIKASNQAIRKSFDDFILQIPDQLPANYPLNDTLTYLENLTKDLKHVENRVVSFDTVKNGEVKKRAVTLGVVQADRETTDQLYNAWMNKQQVQYDSTLYNTGETIVSITTYALKKGVTNGNEVIRFSKSEKKIIDGWSDALGYVDAIKFFAEAPSEAAEEITKTVDPLDALQGHSVAMSDDLVSETSNLWTISNETLQYLRYTWKLEAKPRSESISASNASPIVQAFQVTPLSLNLGESFNITYTVSDSGGSGLRQVELWRKDESSDWQNFSTNTLASETGPISGSFTDSPSAPGNYWYGVHVVDNAGNWNEEKNSNTNGLPRSFEPAEVEVKEVVSAKISSQAPAEEWNKTFGEANTYNEATSVQQTFDGGYILAGNTVHNGAVAKDSWHVAWLIKTDSRGNTIWNRTFFGEKTYFDDYYYKGDISDYYLVASSVQQTSDGGYILAGSEDPYHVGYYDAWLSKIDSEGNEIWRKYFKPRGFCSAISLKLTADGGYILAGSSTNNYFSNDQALLIKTDSIGNITWSNEFGVGEGHSYGSSVQPTTDGGYILTGNRAYDRIAWLIKTDSAGNELWNRTWSFHSEWNVDGIASSQLASDGGYILAGSKWIYSAFASGPNAWLIKTNSEGIELWNKTFGGTNTGIAKSVQQTPDGDYVLAGSTSYGYRNGSSYIGAGGPDAWLIKTDLEGNELWNRTFGGAKDDEATSVQVTSDGGFIVAGKTWSFGAGNPNAWLIKVAPG